ncbi:MAG: HAMP domain-containing histidine kinase [Holophagaceae bacterium]|nr:HAMP domain-containing histidine kinase [Holophagaceae bacterium]
MKVHLRRVRTQRIIFWSVALLLCSQLGWWISLQVRETQAFQDARISQLKAGRAEAWQMDTKDILARLRAFPAVGQGPTIQGRVVVEAQEVNLPPQETRRTTIETHFPYVAVVAEPVADDDPPLFDYSAYITLRKDPLDTMARQRRLALWAVAAQGGFMALGVLLGLIYIYRKLNTEMELVLRQRNFIATVTHELKTPIAALQVWTDTLFARELNEEQKARIHDLMGQDLGRLTELVSNLLEAARAEAGSLELRLEPVDLEPWLRTVCEGMENRLGPGALNLTIELGRDIWVMADPKALGTVIENLLSNAYKYAGEPRQTTVTLDGDRDDVFIVVSDRGNGIAGKEMSRIFQPFYRVGDELTRQAPGSGLGLFLSKEIILRHHGEIRVASRGMGLGSSFTVRLPRLIR